MTPVNALGQRKRFDHWPSKLEAVIEAARGKVFDWQHHNCATFAADCVEAMTGERLHGEFAHLHGSLKAAMRNQKQLRKHITHILATPEVLPAFAQRGDVVLVEWDGWTGLGICTGRQAVCVAREGLSFMHRGAVKCAWVI